MPVLLINIKERYSFHMQYTQQQASFNQLSTSLSIEDPNQNFLQYNYKIPIFSPNNRMEDITKIYSSGPDCLGDNLIVWTV